MTPAQRAAKMQEYNLALQRIVQKRVLVQEALTNVGLVIDDFNRSNYLSSHESMLLERLRKAESTLVSWQRMETEA